NHIGDLIENWGFKHVQGRIWAHLFLSEVPFDAAEIMRRLQISKGLVSISLKEMLTFEIVKKAGKSERGTLLYRVNPDHRAVISNILNNRERPLLSQI